MPRETTRFQVFTGRGPTGEEFGQLGDVGGDPARLVIK